MRMPQLFSNMKDKSNRFILCSAIPFDKYLFSSNYDGKKGFFAFKVEK